MEWKGQAGRAAARRGRRGSEEAGKLREVMIAPLEGRIRTTGAQTDKNGISRESELIRYRSNRERINKLNSYQIKMLLLLLLLLNINSGKR
jgi:hypothetical protein